jgi:hypothetical protein
VSRRLIEIGISKFYNHFLKVIVLSLAHLAALSNLYGDHHQNSNSATSGISFWNRLSVLLKR